MFHFLFHYLQPCTQLLPIVVIVQSVYLSSSVLPVHCHVIVAVRLSCVQFRQSVSHSVIQPFPASVLFVHSVYHKHQPSPTCESSVWVLLLSSTLQPLTLEYQNPSSFFYLRPCWEVFDRRLNWMRLGCGSC